MEEMLPNTIENVHIKAVNGRREINIPITMSGEHFVKWKMGRGGVFFKDIFKWLNNKVFGKYILLEGEGKKAIYRLIE